MSIRGFHNERQRTKNEILFHIRLKIDEYNGLQSDSAIFHVLTFTTVTDGFTWYVSLLNFYFLWFFFLFGFQLGDLNLESK